MPQLIRKRTSQDGKTSSWLTSLPAKNPQPGEKKTVNRTWKTKKEAAHAVALWRLSRGGKVKVSVSLSQAVESYLQVEAQRLRTNTLRCYTGLLKGVEKHFGEVPLESLTPGNIQAFVTGLSAKGSSSSTVKKTFLTLKSVLDMAVDMRQIASNPCQGVRLPRLEHKERQALTTEQIGVFLVGCDGVEWGTAFRLLLSTGLRPSELAALEWRHLDKKTLRVEQSLTGLPGGLWKIDHPKTEAGKRTVPLTENMVLMLKGWREKQTYERKLGRKITEPAFVFARKNGSPVKGVDLAGYFRKLRDQLELPKSLSLYCLRHSFATHLLKNKVNIKAVSTLLGHRDVSVTLMSYVHILEEDISEATNIVERCLQ